MTGTEKEFELLMADVLADDENAEDDPKSAKPGDLYRAAFAQAEARVAAERKRKAKEGLAAHKAAPGPDGDQVARARSRLPGLTVANDDGRKFMMAARKQTGDVSGDEDVLAAALAELEARDD